MLFLIIRKTYGFNKTEDSISLSQMMKSLGLSRVRCSQVINRLQLQKIVTVTEYINGIVKNISLTRTLNNGVPLQKSVTVTEK